jgi:hypothetical protein
VIKKSIVTAVGMLVAYHFILPHLSHRFYQILGMRRSNYLRAQQYVFDTPSETNVVIGSSLSANLSDQILGPSYYKLTFPGGSILTGLEMVRRAHKRPTVVLIETDVLVRNADEELLHDLFSPWLLALRRCSPTFREQGRPSNFIGGFAEACVRKSCQLTFRVFASDQAVPMTSSPSGQVDPAMFERLLRIAREESQHPPSVAQMTPIIDRLREHVQALTTEGLMCVFFELPSDSSLVNMPLQTAQRKMMEDSFPRAEFNWVTFHANHYYHTSDGVHLVRADADLVTERLVHEVNRLIQQQGSPVHRTRGGKHL